MRERVELNAEQKAEWGDTLAALIWAAPGFTHIFYKLLDNGGEDHALFTRDPKVPIAATDGKRLIFNPDRLFALPIEERVFAVGHEIVHNIYGDCEALYAYTSGQIDHVLTPSGPLPVVAHLLQVAFDYRINTLLVDSKIGRPIAGCMLDPKIGKAEDSYTDVYERLWKKDPKARPNLLGLLLPPGSLIGQDPVEAVAGRNPQMWAVEIQTAHTLEQMRAGNIAGSLDRMFKTILEPKVPWQEHIAATLARSTGGGSYDWRRADRRLIVRDIYAPKRSGYGCGTVAVWGDTSGSIGAPALDSYMAELSGILDTLRPERVIVLWCDCEIQNVDELEDAADLERVRCRGVGGGGGTSIEPVLEWIDENMREPPAALVAFTDGYLSFPDEPRYPVVWASITADTQYPWGDVVRI